MSIPFNINTASEKGLAQFFVKEIGGSYSDIADTSTEFFQDFLARCNLSLDDFLRIAINSSGTWQFDDASTYETNGTSERGYPILTANLVSGQRDYKFIQDGAGNLILDVHKVFILPNSTATEYVEISPIDELRENSRILVNGSETGTPTRYGKLSNGIFLETPTNYSVNNGLKMVVSREGSYFTSTDTSKKAGIPSIFHKYLYLKPAREYARIHNLSVFNRLDSEVIKLEGDESQGIVGQIPKYFALREKDLKKGLRANVEDTQ